MCKITNQSSRFRTSKQRTELFIPTENELLIRPISSCELENCFFFCCQIFVIVDWFMMFDATFNSISVILWWWRKPATCCKSLTNFISWCIWYTSPWTGFKLTTLVMIGTDCISGCKTNYHTIMTTPAPFCHGFVL